MKKSALKSLIREEITSTLKGEQPLDEMAKIQGELKTAVDKVLEANPDLEGKELKRAVKNDPDVKDILDETGDELYDNQLNKFIATFRGERTLQQRGRKEGGTNKKPGEFKPDEREMALEGEEELDEISGALAQRASDKAYDKRGKFMDDKDSINMSIKSQQGAKFDKYINPEITDFSQRNGLAVKNIGTGYIFIYFNGIASISIGVDKETGQYQIKGGTVDDIPQSKLKVLGKLIDMIKKDYMGKSEELDEMAKISGDLESAIKAVISANPEIEGLPLKKQIKANPDVIKALDGEDLYDNQLNKFIANIKAGKEKGQQGRKPSEVKPATPGAPRPSTTAKPKEKEKSYSIAPSQTSYTVDKTKSPDENDKLKGVAEPTDYELKQMARSKNVEDERGETLKQQEQRKLVKAFAEKMKKAGIIDSANRILDRAKYDEEWNKEKPIIKDKVAAIQ